MILTQPSQCPGDIPVFYIMAVCYLNIERNQLSLKFGKISLTSRRNSHDASNSWIEKHVPFCVLETLINSILCRYVMYIELASKNIQNSY